VHLINRLIKVKLEFDALDFYRIETPTPRHLGQRARPTQRGVSGERD
jgi:hypothetical protein